MIINRYLEAHSEAVMITLIGPLYDADSMHFDPVIYIDGGARFRRSDRGITVGDGDSYDKPLDHLLETEKDFSDLAFVLKNISGRYKEVQLLGFLGGRKDHELFNLGEVHQFLRTNRKKCTVLFDQSIIAYSAGEWSFNITGIFSIAVFQKTQITLTGKCRYPLCELTTIGTLSSHGLSNEGDGEISLSSSGPVFLFYPLQDRSE